MCVKQLSLYFGQNGVKKRLNSGLKDLPKDPRLVGREERKKPQNLIDFSDKNSRVGKLSGLERVEKGLERFVGKIKMQIFCK